MRLTDSLPDATLSEQVEVLARSEAGRVERIVSHGQASPEGFWYEQDEHEYVVVLSGWGVLEFSDGGTVRLGPNEGATLPAGTKHRVQATSPDEPTVWLAFFWQDPQ